MALRFALVVFAGLFSVSSSHAQAPASLRTDLLGDPLPAGAVARLGTLRFKHSFSNFLGSIKGDIKFDAFGPRGISSPISKAVFSPDGKKIASTDFSTVRMWDAASGKVLPDPWSGSQRGAIAAFSPHSNLFAVSGQTVNSGRLIAEIAVWDLAGGKLINALQLPQAEGVQALAFANDGKTLISAGNGNVRWWDIATGQEKRTWKPFNDEQQPFPGGTMTKTFFRCELSPGGKYLAVQSSWRYQLTDRQQPPFLPADDQDNWGFDLTTTKPRWRTRVKATDFQVQFAFSADEKWVAQTVEANKVELRETATGKLMATPPLEARTTQTRLIGALALSSDGATLAIGGPNSQVTMWNAAEPANYRQFSGRITLPSPNSLRCLAFSPDNKTLAAGLDSDLQLYDVVTLKEVFPWDGHRGYVDYLAFAPDGKRLVTGSATSNLQPSEVVNWDMATWKATSFASSRTPKWPNIGTLSPDYAFFIGKDGDDRVCIYDYATGKKVARLDVPTDQIPSGNGFFSPAGRFFVLFGPVGKQPGAFQLFAVPSGKLACALPPIGIAKGAFSLPTFSPGERLVAFSSQDSLIHVFDTTTGELKKQLGKSPEGAPGFIRQGLLNLAFSSDNKMLAYLSSLDNVIHVWELSTGKERFRLPPGEQGRGQVKFAWSPDGRTLAVGDRKIQLFEVATGKVRREYEGHQGAILALAFSPDGRLLASGSADTTVLMWDVWGR